MDKQVILITGASSGIGRELAFEFARHGQNLLLVARRGDKLADVQREIYARDPSNSIYVELCTADLTKADAAEKIAAFCAEHHLSVDCLVNNAGIGAEGDFAELDMEKQQRIVELNVLALMRLCHAFLPQMRQRRHGCIVNIASTTAFMPLAGEAVYAASKAFVLSFSQALYEENKAYGLTVCTLCPGVTDTEFFANAGFRLQSFKAASPSDFAAFAYRAVTRCRPLAVHGAGNRLIALWARLLPRGHVRTVAAKLCK